MRGTECGSAAIVVATVGTKLYMEDKEWPLSHKIRGEESLGMICSEIEVGMNVARWYHRAPGRHGGRNPAKEYYNVQSDHLIEVDITPNRVDAASHFGVARDLAAYLKQEGKPFELKKPSIDEFKVDSLEGGIEVIVENSTACPRYSGLTLRGVTVKESPDWLKNYLTTIGLRPINNVVDITNFVLHETGHPLHAFSADTSPATRWWCVRYQPKQSLSRWTKKRGTERK